MDNFADILVQRELPKATAARSEAARAVRVCHARNEAARAVRVCDTADVATEKQRLKAIRDATRQRLQNKEAERERKVKGGGKGEAKGGGKGAKGLPYQGAWNLHPGGKGGYQGVCWNCGQVGHKSKRC